MIEHDFDAEKGVVHLRPTSSLSQSDFEQVAKTIDPFIENNGDLSGLIIEMKSFPGWESFGAIVAHFRFVRNHHKHIKKVALVTDSALGNLGEQLASHFVAAKIQHFAAKDLSLAKQWIAGEA